MESTERVAGFKEEVDGEIGNQEQVESSEGKLSKRQMKKQAKQQKWLEKREEFKQKKKESKHQKKSRTSQAHISRFNHLTTESAVSMAEQSVLKVTTDKEETKGGESTVHRVETSSSQLEGGSRGKSGLKLTKKEKQDLFKKLCELGPRYVIDCDFEDYMGDRELKSLGQQLAYCHSVNKKLEQPINLHFTGVGPRLKKLLTSQNCQNWAVTMHYQESGLKAQGTGCKNGYLECEDLGKDRKSRLVYLTADSENLVQDLDPECIYVVGGIVDHNKHKLLTYTRAKEQGIGHGRLPIRENIELDTSAVLTVNHVFEIIGNYLTLKNWKKALELAIPERKRKQPSKDDGSKEKVISGDDGEGSSAKDDYEPKEGDAKPQSQRQV